MENRQSKSATYSKPPGCFQPEGLYRLAPGAWGYQSQRSAYAGGRTADASVSILQMFQARIQNFFHAPQFRAPQVAHVIKALIDRFELGFVLQPDNQNSESGWKVAQKGNGEFVHSAVSMR